METCYPWVAKQSGVHALPRWAEQRLLWWMNLRRISYVMAVLGGYGCWWVFSALANRWGGLRRLCPNLVSGPVRLRQLFEELGGSFIKFGQMLALQPDILSLEYCNALFDLMDRVSPLPFAEVERVFKDELGRKPSEVFDSIDTEPLATASIGQVHVAWLNGRKLAVKIQRPSVGKDFAGDVRLMSGTVQLIRVLHLTFVQWMIEPMSEFMAWTREELDYRYEASYMRKLRQNASDNPREHVPAVLEEFTTQRTLVMEFLAGTTVLSYLRALEQGNDSAIDRLTAKEFDCHKVASNIIDNFLGDVFQYGLFHADLHPANLMILPGNVVGYVDFGITGTISEYSRQALIGLTLAYTSGDLKGMCKAFFRVSTLDSETSEVRFHRGLERDARSWYEQDGREVRLRKNFTLVMLDMLRLSRETGVWPERDVIKYIRSAIAIDGLITRFAPSFDVGQHLRTTCDRYLKLNLRRQLFSMSNLIGWTAASGNLVRDGGVRALEALSRLADLSTADFQNAASSEASSGPTAFRVAYLAGFICTICFAALRSPHGLDFGSNLFTAEVILAGIAFAWLINSVRKIPQRG